MITNLIDIRIFFNYMLVNGYNKLNSLYKGKLLHGTKIITMEEVNKCDRFA